MSDLSTSIIILHAYSLIFWIGGLFAYLFIVWPSIFATARGVAFPRETLGILANKTAPWIYMAMISALVTAIMFYFVDEQKMVSDQLLIGYILILCMLIGNNAYGTMNGWARILWTPDDKVMPLWRNFYIRMLVSFIIGSVLLLGLLILLLVK